LTWRRARAWNADMASDPRVMWNFECPSCGAKYLKTKIEDQAENREGANCEHCLASFEPREGAYLFQYELIEHPVRRQMTKAPAIRSEKSHGAEPPSTGPRSGGSAQQCG
jgi:hypothetical protein